MRVRPITSAVLALSCLVFAASASAQDEDELILRVYRVSDLLAPAPNYRYDGDVIPTTGVTGGTKSSPGTFFGGGTEGAAGAGMQGGGVIGSGMGGMGGGAGMGGGGGFFRVPPRRPMGAAAPVADPRPEAMKPHLTLAQMGGGMGGMGGLGGGLGGGIAMPDGSPSADVGANLRFNMRDLIAVIVSVVAPDSWDEMGGPGTLKPLGGVLVVSQTAAVHKKIETLLDEIRSQGGALRTMTVSAQWLRLSAEQLADLTSAGQGKSPTVVDATALAKLPPEAVVYRGQISCFANQTVYLVSGRGARWWPASCRSWAPRRSLTSPPSGSPTSACCCRLRRRWPPMKGQR